MPAARKGVGADGAGQLDDHVVALFARDDAEGAIEEIVDDKVGRTVEMAAADRLKNREAG